MAPGGQGQAPMRITGVETKAHRSRGGQHRSRKELKGI